MFQGIKNLRGENEQIEYTKELIDEYIKCKEDIIYFAENYVWITTLDKGNMIIKLYDYQKKILKAFIDPPDDKRHLIILQPRQSGKCFCQDTMIKIRNKKTGKIEEVEAKKFFEKIKSTK